MEKCRLDIELAEAIALIAGTTPLDGTETTPLDHALGRVLVADIFSRIDQPPFNRSALDGYALRSCDAAAASPESPVTLAVVGKLHCGDAPFVGVSGGQAVRIMTGAPIPGGCDCVIMQEEIHTGNAVDAEQIVICRSLSPHKNVCFRGEDFKSGERLLKAGSRINAAAIGALSSAGLTEISVRRQPRIALVTTGDELVQPGQTLPPGKIYSGNLPLLAARLCELGLAPCRELITADNPAETANTIREIMRDADALITTGGVSVGEKDILNEVIPLLGARQVFHGVCLKPGSPAMFSFFKGKPILSLSGNPFAAAATFELLARPLLAALCGDPALLPLKFPAVMESAFDKVSPSPRFARGTFANGCVTLPHSHSSGQLLSLAECNCLVEIPPDTRVKHGDTLSVYLL